MFEAQGPPTGYASRLLSQQAEAIRINAEFDRVQRLNELRRAQGKSTVGFDFGTKAGFINPRLLGTLGGIGLGGLAGGPLGAIAGGALGLTPEIAKGVRRVIDFFRNMGERGAAGTGGITPGDVAAARASAGGGAPPRQPPFRPVAAGQGFIDEFATPHPHGRRLGAAAQGLLTYVTAATAIYTALAAFQNALSQAVDFEQKLAQLRGVLPAGGINDLLLIQDAVIQNASKYGQSVSEVVEVAQALVQTGRSASEVVTDLDRILRGATGLGLQLNSAQELLIAVRSLTKDLSTGTSGIDTDIFDRIAVAQQNAAVSALDLAEAVKTILPTARELRGEFVGLTDEVDIILASVGQIVQRTGVPGAQAATSLRNTLARLGRPEVIKALQNIGGAKLGTIESAGTELRPLTEILAELARVYKELNGVDKQRLLTQVAGSRQTNALAALLTNFAEVQETAEKSALAFGNAQLRTGFALETTRNKLNQVSTSLQGIGIAFLQSKVVGDAFRGVLTGIAGALRWISSDISQVIPKFALFTAGILLTIRTLRLFGTSFLFTLGARTATELATAGAAFGTFGAYVVGQSRRIGLALSKSALFGGLLGALGPGGTIALVIAGLAALGLAIIKIINLRNQYKSLRLNLLTPEQVAENAAPRVQQFKTKAVQFGVSPADLLEGVRQSAETALPALVQLAGGLDKVKTLSRAQIFQTVFPILEDNIDGFTKAMKVATKGMTEQEAEAEKLKITMDLLGEAAFIRSGIIQANYNELVRQTEGLGNKLTVVFDKLSESTEKLFLFSATTGRAGGGNVRLGALEVLLKIADQAKGIDAAIGPLFRLILESGQATGVFTEALAGLDSSFKRLGGITIPTGQALDLFAAHLQKTMDQAERGKLISDLAVRLRTVLLTKPGDLNIAEGLLGTPTKQETNISRYLSDVFGEAITKLQEEELARLGGVSELELIKRFERSGQGVRAVITDLSSALVGVKNPLTDFLQDLFFTVQGFKAAEDAAKTFGLSLANLAGDRVRALEGLAQKLAILPLDSFRQLLEAEQRLGELQIVDRRLGSRRVGGLSEAETTKLKDEQTNIGTQIDRLETQKKVLSAFTGQFNLEAASNEAIKNLGALVRNDVQLTEEVQQTLQAILGDTALKPEEQQSKVLEYTRAVVKKLLDREVGRFQLDLARKSAVEEARVSALDRLNAVNEIERDRLEQSAELKGFGLSPLQGLPVGLELINKQRELAVNLAEQLHTQELAIANQKLKTLDLSAAEFVARADELASTKKQALAAAELTAETDKRKAINKAIFEQNQQLLQQTQENLRSRLSGLRELLTSFDKIRKGSLVTLLEPIGKNFIERQADTIIAAFSKGGLLSKIGDIIGGAGEADPIVLAHTTGAAAGASILSTAIIQAHAVGAGLLSGQNPADAAANGSAAVRGVQSVLAGIAASSTSTTPSLEDRYNFAGEGALTNISAKNKASQRQQLLLGVASLVGNVGGSALGGGGRGAQIGASLGAGAGSLLGPLGALGGGILGGLLGGLFDKDTKGVPAVTQLERIARSSGEQVTLLENTNRLLEAQNLAFNVPSTFRLPAFGSQLFAGQSSVSNEIVVNVNVGSTTVSAQELGKTISEAVAVRLQQEYNAGGSYSSRTSY
jgi:hypothetical protein